MGDKDLEYEQLTDLVTGEIDRQLKHRGDVLDTMKSQMTKVFQEFEELTINVQAKRSWMKSVNKTREIHPTSTVAIHPITTNSHIGPPPGAAPTSPSRLPKLSGLKARKKLQQQLNRNMSGTLPLAEGVPSDARQEGKIVFDKKLPRVAHIEKRTDGLQSMLASQQKQVMYEKALVRYPQCRSNVFAPSIYDDNVASEPTSPLSPQATPQTSLELDFVYGVNNGVVSNLSQTNTAVMSSNTSISNNIAYLATGEIMWFAASLVVLYSKQANTQRYFREHTNQVTSIAVHPNQHVVASGQVGRETFVLVWDANDDPLGKRFACLMGHSVAVRSISFSHDGKLVASLGGDMFNTICVHDWREQTMLVSARGHSFRVHTIAFNPYQAYGRPETKRGKKPGQALQDGDVCYTLVSCGVRHIRFWTLTKTEFWQPPNEESEESAFYGSSFGSPARLHPPAPQERIWKMEGNVPSFHGRLDVQDFTSVTFVDDSPPLYVYDEQTKELIATDANDHSLGRIIAGTAKGDLCVFFQPRKSPDVDEIPKSSRGKEPAKWWEIPDEYTDAEINALVLEKFIYEPTAKLVEVVPHDVETGNRYKLTKATQVEIDGIHKRLQVKPNSAALQARLAELKYAGALAHQGSAYQLAYCKKNNLIISSGADGRLMLWKCQLTQPIRVPGVSTQGLFTPLTGTFSEGSHTLMQLDDEIRVFKLPSQYPDDSTASTAAQPKPTSVSWKEDGKHVIVGTSSNSVWELNVLTGAWSLVFEARSGAMAACSCHPTKEEVVTVSYDGYVCLWDLRRHVCKHRMYIGGEKVPAQHPSSPKPTCMEFHPFGDEIVIGMSNGQLLVMSYPDLRIIKQKFIKPYISATRDTSEPLSHGGSPCVVQVKYDPNGNTLAVGAKDTFIYVYDVTNGYKKLHVCEGHSSAVLQLTWSTEGDALQSNAGDGEVLFWTLSNGTMKQITDGFQVRDTQWVKWTCVFGWATPGIWHEDSSNLVDIAAVATTGPLRRSVAESNGESPAEEIEDLLAVANRNTLRLFRWPVPRGSKSKSYHAHSALISSVCFAFNDRYVLTTGGEDGTLIQWRCVLSEPSVASPSRPAAKRKQQQQHQLRLNYGEDGESSEFATSPVPPPAAGRSNKSQPSPRQVSRQYREKTSDRDAEEPSPLKPSNSSQALAVIAQCRVKHDFKAENSDEINLTTGELIRVLKKENADWWFGESCDGTRGIFPTNYVDELPMTDATAAAEAEAVATDAEVIRHEEVASSVSTPHEEPLYEEPPRSDPEEPFPVSPPPPEEEEM